MSVVAMGNISQSLRLEGLLAGGCRARKKGCSPKLSNKSSRCMANEGHGFSRAATDW
jgi:hypothetical protein